jgi:hypothetical protein
MGWDFSFDPQTKDTIPDGRGSIKLTYGAETQVRLQFECEFAAWWGDHRAGVRSFKALGDNPNAIANDRLRALKVLADAGVISNPTAIAERSTEVTGRVKLLTTARDTRTGRTINTGDVR